MSDHYPDCPVDQGVAYSTTDASVVWATGECICAALRACEARVREEVKSTTEALGEFFEPYHMPVWSAGYVAGKRDALDAAREAADVALLGTLQSTRDRVIAAIDALRVAGAPHEDPCDCQDCRDAVEAQQELEYESLKAEGLA